MANETPDWQIPQPKPSLILKNLTQLDAQAPIQSMMRLARTYGPLFQLELPNRTILIASSQELVNELCDENRFDKRVHAPLQKLRDFVGDGLFTAHTQEPNWEKAHRILLPAFGPASVRNMFDQMVDIADQMLLKWERLGEGTLIDVSDNMTRLTLDTIALCAFDYRFNSFYQHEMHPFVGAMVNALKEANNYGRRLPLQNRLMFITRRRYEREIEYMSQITSELIAERRRHHDRRDTSDLLGRMLSGRDPETGEGLSDQNIIHQMITFLIAGHETTSGLLSFALYELLKNPHTLRQAQAQVDQVVGNEPLRFEHLAKLPYLDQVLKETLRIWPTAPAFAVNPYEDTLLAGKYPVKKGQTIFVVLPELHRDPKVWSGDVEQFDPDRFTPEAMEQLPPNAWKPFGNGQRACIGRPFALQEAHIALAKILQRFDLVEAASTYALVIKETLTMKPEGFHIRATRRSTQPPPEKTTATGSPTPETRPSPAPASTVNGAPLLVLYGSNSGSSEAFAQRITADGQQQGYAPQLATLDAYAGQLPSAGAVIIVTASYEGQPTDNAKKFVQWLDSVKSGELAGVQYAVFGCGNRDWVHTYQAIPKKIDQQLATAGATRLIERGEADAEGDFFGDFDRWYEMLWPKLGAVSGQAVVAESNASRYTIDLVRDGRPVLLRLDNLQLGQVVENRELVSMTIPEARSKRHLELVLPDGMSYRAGDYLAVLPVNPPENVDRALRRFGFDRASQVIIRQSEQTPSTLPTGYPVSVNELLAGYVELAQTVTRKQVETLGHFTQCPPEKQRLAAYAGEATYKTDILEKHVSLLDLLEQFPACEIDFGRFLHMLPPMKTRQYSISSSPLWKANHCTLTLAVVDDPAWSGQGRYKGAASNYLAQALVDTRLSVSVKASQAAFHLPDDLLTPLILIGAGSGIAPLRGFIQDRSVQKASGQTIGETLLFFGCHHPDVDFLYRNELAEWERQGVVSVRPAFSLAPEGKVRYVQHRVWQDRAAVERLFRQGARIYVCGDGRRMAPAVRETLIRIYQEVQQTTPQQAQAWADELERSSSRYVTDVFS